MSTTITTGDARAAGPGDDWGIGRLRVMLLNYEYPPLGGGAGVATAALAEGLAARGALVDVVTARPADERAPAVERPRPNLTVHRVACRRTAVHEARMVDAVSYVVAALPVVRRLLRAQRYDVAHLFFALPTGLLLPVFKLCGVPTVVALRGSDVPGYDPWNRRLQRVHRLVRPITRWIWRHADRVVALSTSLGELARRTDPNLHVAVVRNGVDVERFRPGPQRRRLSDRVRCIAVARLVDRKGLDDLLHALARLERGRYRLELVGSGPEEGALRALAARLGVAEDVRFVGALDHRGVAERLRAADLFVLPSREESFGNAFAEALASGLPVIGTAVGGIPEFVEHGRHGFLVPPQDPAALAAAIRLLGEHPMLRAEMAARNRAHAIQTLSWEAVTERYLGIYADVRRRPCPGHRAPALAVIR